MKWVPETLRQSSRDKVQYTFEIKHPHLSTLEFVDVEQAVSQMHFPAGKSILAPQRAVYISVCSRAKPRASAHVHSIDKLALRVSVAEFYLTALRP